MRCVACNKNLSDFESTRKTPDGEYLDMCNECATIADMHTEDRFDLMGEADAAELEVTDVEDFGLDYISGAEQGNGFYMVDDDDPYSY